jgi:hypothetical protein
MLLLVMPSMQVSQFLQQIYQNLTFISTAMTLEQREMVMDLRDPPNEDDDDWEMLDDVLRGDSVLDISHEGGELDALGDRIYKNTTYVTFFLCSF